eukprot:TRINITY_DN787_c0_g1_i5.p1 TRINITY_DN787_c0_g1~~TRINITY_DN787_c0_g1_i5.p1  ORF type:complete len:217 (+),score=61.58 TRINITY_DN787_c0_g1_i5:381-1031(+)
MLSSRHLIVVLVIGVVSAQRAERFCPRERRDGFECRAKTDQFKCGIFFDNLLGGREIKWIGALPDAIAKTRRKDPELIKTIFPKVNKKPVEENYFQQWSNTCDSAEANSKCYLLMDQIADDRLDSCKKTVGNLDGEDTIGNQLCGQARRFLASAKKDTSKGLRNQPLAFYSSTCKGKWNPVSSDVRGNLQVNEKLCCDSSWKYVKCDGGNFNRSCN